MREGIGLVRYRRLATLLVAGFAFVATACTSAASNEPDPISMVTITLDQELPSGGRLGGVAADDSGNVYISNFGLSIWRITPDGHVERLPVDVRGSSGNHVTQGGRILQASFVDNEIVEIRADGEARVLEVEGLEGPVGLTTDSEGRIFVNNCQGNTITVTDSAGTKVLASGSPLACPNGITWGPDGMLYVVSFGNSVVTRVSPETGEMSELATLPPAPQPPGQNAHIVFAAGRLWVTRIQQGELYAVDLDGSFERVFGGQGRGIVDGTSEVAQLANPNGITAGPEGRFLYLNDIVGTWRGEEETHMVLRRVGPLF